MLDQRVIAGVGNVYRAELLFRLGLSPFRPGRELEAGQVERIWAEATVLLELGLAAGWIVTDDRQMAAARQLADAGQRVPRWPKVYAVYRRTGRPCRVCGTPIASERMGQQQIYWCPRCQ